jgi:hypothetical protein
VTRTIFLDTGPLSYVTHPNDTGDRGLCKQWLAQLGAAKVSVRVPAIADYELRRELIRIRSAASIALLNKLIRSTGGLVPINSQVMRKAAELWAQSRWDGVQTGDDTAIDGDMILCAQVLLFAKKGHTVQVATTNVKHLESYVDAKKWTDITV